MEQHSRRSAYAEIATGVDGGVGRNNELLLSCYCGCESYYSQTTWTKDGGIIADEKHHTLTCIEIPCFEPEGPFMQ